MGLVSGFERRLERSVDGFFSRLFRSGVHPVEIGKRVLRVMEDGKTAALKRTYVPNVYGIHLARKDYDKLAPIAPKLVEELEAFVSEAARQRKWVLADTPRVSLMNSTDLRQGEFRIHAESVSLSPARRRARASVAATPQAVVAAPARTESALVVLSDGTAVRTITVNDRVTIGRQADNDLVLPDSGVSRNHAEVVKKGSDCIVRDLGSTNGTTVNDEIVEESVLYDGDRIGVGHTVIEYRRS